jgi:hypothetical protein
MNADESSKTKSTRLARVPQQQPESVGSIPPSGNIGQWSTGKMADMALPATKNL